MYIFTFEVDVLVIVVTRSMVESPVEVLRVRVVVSMFAGHIVEEFFGLVTVQVAVTMLIVVVEALA